MANLNDFTKKNPIFTGNTGIRIPSGTNADRDETANTAATFRYNQDIGGVEFYGPTGWVPLAAPPSISTVTPANFNGESGTEFTINGANFTADAQVYFVTANGTDLLASTVSFIGPGQLRATTPRDILVAEEPLDIRIVQSSGTVTKLDVIDAGGVPNWVTTAGTLGSVFGANTVNVYVSATDPEESAVTYTINSGSLPNGLALTTANGLIQGLANSVLANTTFNFTIRASDTVNNNTDRTFSYTILNRAPVINTAAGSLGTFYSGNAVPSTTIDAYDPDNGQIQFNLTSGSLPANTELGLSTGTISGTSIVVNANTTYTFEVTANDEGSLTASNTYSFTVLNRFPVWNTAAGSLADITDDEIGTYTPITVNAYDPDGEVVTYQLTQGSVPAGLTFVSANAAIAGVPESVESNTTSTFTVVASDGNNETAREFTMTVRLPLDPYFKETVLLLHGDGSANSNNNLGFTDSSDNNFAITVNGDAYESNFGPYAVPEGNWSNFFDGTGDILIAPNDSDFAFGTGDFTVEAWFYKTATTSESTIIANIASSADGQAALWLYINGNNAVVTSTWFTTLSTSSNDVVSNNTWNHVAFCRSGTNASVWVNGTRVSNYTLTNNLTATTGYRVGGYGTASGPFQGYISNARVVKGTAVYNPSSTNITVPTSSLTAISGTSLLTCQSNRFKDNSTNNFTITRGGDVKVEVFNPFGVLPDGVNGSGYFDGTADNLRLLGDASTAFGTDPFCVEAWIYPTNMYNYMTVVSTRESNGAFASAWGLGIYGNGTFVAYGSANILIGSAGDVKLNEWQHVVFCRNSSNNTGLFVNGTRIAYSASITTNYTLQRVGIGDHSITNAEAFTGYISNVRMVKGSNIYDPTQSTLTIPSSPVTNVSGTSLLTCQYPGSVRNVSFIDSGPHAHRITRNGNTAQGTFSPFSKPDGAWSNYFDGSGDSLNLNGGSSLILDGVDFTIEAWVFLESGQNTQSLLNFQPHSTIAISLNRTGVGDTYVYIGNGSSWLGVPAINTNGVSNLSFNTWHHIALVRNGSTLTLYQNGAVAGTTSTLPSGMNGNLYIGAVFTSSASEFLKGNISNFRVVKGTAVYTSTFTPPSSALTAISGTSLLTCQSNRFKDNSTNNFTITRNGDARVTAFSPFKNTNAYSPTVNGGSAYFDGSGDYLSVASSPTFSVGTGDVTIETWFYPIRTSTFQGIISARSQSAVTLGLFITNANLLEFSLGGAVMSASGILFNSWNHVVGVRSTVGGTTTTSVFLNGTRVITNTTTTGSDGSPLSLALGRYYTDLDNYYYEGWISGARILKGTAAYDPTQTTITVPTIPNTSSSQTSILTNFTNAGIYDSTGLNALETIGNAQVDTSVKKYGTGSMRFGVNDSYLLVKPNDTLEFGSSDFTIEFWWYPTSTARQALYHGSFGPDYSIGIDYSSVSTNQKIGIWASSNGSSWNLINADGGGNGIGTTTVTQNAWNHIAYVRNGTTWMLFVNGNRDLNLTGISGSIVNRITFQKGIGVWFSTTVMAEASGFIDEFRITKGIARYTSNFTPRSRAFPNV